MTFTDRSMLVALVALAIPLAIHLLGRRRARRVLLPTARFAEGAHQAGRAALWLKRAALLASRLAVVALLVLALAGPHVGAEAQAPGETRAPSVSSGVSSAKENVAPFGETPELTLGARRQPPIRVLVVDAAAEADAQVRSALLVALALAPDDAAPSSKQVTRTDAAKLAAGMLDAADVVFWVGPHAPAAPELLAGFIARGGAMVWVPADVRPPEASLAKVLGASVGAAQAAPAGSTIDPAGYTSDLVAAFEAGTSGDLAAPVFTQRLTPAGAPAIRFRDGAAVAVDHLSGKGRVVVLAVGPSPAWGNLFARPEFVVLVHSMAEALAPKPASPVKAPVAAEPPAPPPASSVAPPATDLTLWFILALAAALVAEGFLAATIAPTKVGG